MFPLQPSGPLESCLFGVDGGAVRAPAPATLRITNARESIVEVLVVRSQALQSQAEKIQVPSVFITVMFYIHFLHALIIICVYDYMIVCVTLCVVYLKYPPRNQNFHAGLHFIFLRIFICHFAYQEPCLEDNRVSRF